MAFKEDVNRISFNGASGILHDIGVAVEDHFAPFRQDIPVSGDGAALLRDRAGACPLHIILTPIWMFLRPYPTTLHAGAVSSGPEGSNQFQPIEA